MVNNGASRACNACKQRHKKCDETRPSCLRCNRARRICPGYNTVTHRRFVNYAAETEADFNSLYPQLGGSIDLVQNVEFAQIDVLDLPNIEQRACSEFFADYCITSSNQNISRGYMHGLQTMIDNAGPTSELAKACTTIALANLGRKVGNAMLIQMAERQHSLLLRSFRLSISDTIISTTVESLITAALLGLYEIITSIDARNGAHIAHARGVSAILLSTSSPFNLSCGGKLFQVKNPLPLEDLEIERSKLPLLQYSRTINYKMAPIFSVLCAPIVDQSHSGIDMMFVQTEGLILKAKLLLASDAALDQIYSLKLEAEQMNERFDAWPRSHPMEWSPKWAGIIVSKDDEIPGVGYWPGTVSSYYDAYVAAIWNSYRKVRLLILNIILNCHHRINDSTHQQEAGIPAYKEIDGLVEDIVSSIPFLLSADLQVFLEKATADAPSLDPGKPIGGLLLMHTLYVLSTLPMLEAKLKVYIKDCQAWIGDRMGIGQATILSKATTFDGLFEYITEAHVLIWVGMLI